MSTSTISLSSRAASPRNTPERTGFTLAAIVDFLFAVKLRESLDAATSGDKSDAAMTWGM